MDCAGCHFAALHSSANIRITPQVLAFVELSFALVTGSATALAFTAIIVVPTTTLPVPIFVVPAATFPWPLLIVVIVARPTSTIFSLAEDAIAIFTLVAAVVSTLSLSRSWVYPAY